MGCCPYTHFTVEETEGSVGEDTCSESHNQKVACLEFDPRPQFTILDSLIQVCLFVFFMLSLPFLCFVSPMPLGCWILP